MRLLLKAEGGQSAAKPGYGALDETGQYKQMIFDI